MPRFCPAFSGGSRAKADMCCISDRSFTSHAPKTPKLMCCLQHNSAMLFLRAGFVGILTSGCGYTGAGRRGLQANQLFIDCIAFEAKTSAYLYPDCRNRPQTARSQLEPIQS